MALPDLDVARVQQGTNCTCIHPSGVGVQHFGAFGSGCGVGGSSAWARPVANSTAVARTAMIASLVLIKHNFRLSAALVKSIDPAIFAAF
jgi:hypothetical protein